MSFKLLEKEAALLAWGKRNKKIFVKDVDPVRVKNIEFEAFIEGFFSGADFGMSEGIDAIECTISEVIKKLKGRRK